MDRATAEQLVADFVAAYNTGDPDLFDRCLVPDYRHPNPAVPDRAAFKAVVARWCEVVADLSLTVEDLVVEGDRIVVRMTFSGRQVGEVLGIPATGREFSVGLIDIFQVADGRLARHWDQMDLLGLHRQLGALPPAAVPAPAARS
ncbi:ester cyclase [Streptomyces tateyamensis]|uniref:Ester cyclase n=1 Tax=Streptomyces tateyamensis TaxID=565073 RepID=A0A2V4P6D5_9ACTN|nr:ester cyclase [Streptomyces tateyamensis]AXG25736.1 NTF-2 family protein [Streptomyces tateyamensis]PYC80208.1 ester cyclase [Streptomyces tateyamensis]